MLFVKFNFTNATELMPTKFEHLNFTSKMEKPKELFFFVFCFLIFFVDAIACFCSYSGR